MGAAAVAVLIRRERELVEAFRASGATSPDRAGTLDALGLGQTIAVRRLKRRAVLRETPSGALWLDEPSWVALRGMRRRMALVMLAVVLLLALAGVYFTRRSSGAAASHISLRPEQHAAPSITSSAAA